MTTFADGLFQYGGMPVGGGVVLPFGPASKSIFVDPSNGSDGNTGLTPQAAKKTLLAAYNLTTSGKHDVVYFIGGAGQSSDAPTSAVTWANNDTHLIGLSSPLPGMGQRSRVVNSSANDLAVLFTLSGSGCIIANMQFFDGKDSAADGACVLVSGSRNYFKNVFVAGMGDGTASGPFSRAGSYSLKVSGHENTFDDCTIGLDTVARTAANSELIVSGAKNKFRHCEIRSNSTTAGKFLVKIDNSVDDMRDNQFDECLFFNYTSNWATGITDAFDMPAGGNTHYVVFRGNNVFVGVGTGIADTVTHVYGAGPAPNAGMFVATNPTT